MAESAHGPGGDGDDVVESAATLTETSEKSSDQPWFRRPRNLAVLGLLAVAVIAAVVLAFGRGGTSPAGGSPDKTLAVYFSDNDITTTPVLPGDPGAPRISFTLPRGWSDAGPDTPEGAYGAAFHDASDDQEYPASVIVLLSKVGGNADPEQILKYATGELLNLPDYIPVTKPKKSTMSGFDAVQLGGLYTRADGEERIIAQKTVVIPEQDGLYLLQLNVDAPKDEAPVLQEATAYLDDQAKITPSA